MLSIYKASAGSGKTYTLAYQYIKMLLGRQQERAGDYRLDTRSRRRHRSILAITFTNKATDEMKQRIIHELAVIAGAEPGWTAPSPYMADLCRDLKATPEQIAAEARRAMADLLFDYGFFAVSTIDSFFQQVLRTFAREADLTGNYEVDLDKGGMIALALAQLFRSIEYSDDTATRRTASWLSTFLRSRMIRGESVELFNRNSNLFGNLLRFVKSVLNETFDAHADELTAYLADPDRLPRLAEALTAALDNAASHARDACRRCIALLNGREGITRYVFDPIFRYASQEPVPKAAEPSATLLKALANPDSAIKKDKKSAALLADRPLIDAIGDAAQAISDYYTTTATLEPVRDNIHFLGLLGDVMRQMDILRRDNNTLLLSDTNSILSRIIGDDETPFVYERMGVWVEHFLIDEFQDTSRLQWANLRPLINEGLATDRDSLIIGDEKQCIYRFRSSDPTLLQHKVQQQFAESSHIHGDTAEGNTNWRSSATVVSFNNDFFSRLAEDAGLGDIYANVRQEISGAHKNHEGYVALYPAEGNAAEAAQEGYARMADEIARQIASGYCPADIAVLARKKRHAVGAINYLLRRQADDPDYPRFRIISDDSIQLGSSQAVRLVISVMRSVLLSRPGEEAAAESSEKRRRNHTLAEAVLARLVNDYEYAAARGCEPSQALAQAVEAAADGPGCESGHAPQVDTAMTCPNLQTLTDRIIATFTDPGTLADEHIYLSALQDVVATFTMRGGSDLRAFLEWWDRTGRFTAVASPQAPDTLRVMTIHKSKGLEFKCVHIPVGDWDYIDFRDPEWFDTPEGLGGIDPALLPPLLPVKPEKRMEATPFAKQYSRRVNESILDETNTLYVAFTRAVDELIVTYASGAAKSSGSGAAKKSGLSIRQTLASLGSEDGRYESGSPTSPAPAEASRRTAVEPEGIELIPTLVPGDKPSVWADTRIDMPVDPLTPRGRGIMLHDILAGVRSADSLDRAVRRMVSRGAVPAALAPELHEILARSLARPDVRRWFEGFTRVMTERPIAIGPDGTDHRRPDRVVWTADGHVDVIDYKSGEERPKSHHRQVAFYMAQLRRLGYRNVRGYLWYLDSGEIVTVNS